MGESQSRDDKQRHSRDGRSRSRSRHNDADLLQRSQHRGHHHSSAHSRSGESSRHRKRSSERAHLSLKSLSRQNGSSGSQTSSRLESFCDDPRSKGGKGAIAASRSRSRSKEDRSRGASKSQSRASTGSKIAKNSSSYDSYHCSRSGSKQEIAEASNSGVRSRSGSRGVPGKLSASHSQESNVSANNNKNRKESAPSRSASQCNKSISYASSHGNSPTPAADQNKQESCKGGDEVIGKRGPAKAKNNQGRRAPAKAKANLRKRARSTSSPKGPAKRQKRNPTPYPIKLRARQPKAKPKILRGNKKLPGRRELANGIAKKRCVNGQKKKAIRHGYFKVLEKSPRLADKAKKRAAGHKPVLGGVKKKYVGPVGRRAKPTARRAAGKSPKLGAKAAVRNRAQPTKKRVKKTEKLSPAVKKVAAKPAAKKASKPCPAAMKPEKRAMPKKLAKAKVPAGSSMLSHSLNETSAKGVAQLRPKAKKR